MGDTGVDNKSGGAVGTNRPSPRSPEPIANDSQHHERSLHRTERINGTDDTEGCSWPSSSVDGIDPPEPRDKTTPTGNDETTTPQPAHAPAHVTREASAGQTTTADGKKVGPDGNPSSKSDDRAEAWRAFREHESFLLSTARRLTGDADIAKDLVHDVFVKATIPFFGLPAGSNVRAWLTTILERTFLDNIKHKTVVDKAVPQLCTLQSETCHIATDEYTDEDLYTAVDRLPWRLREVIIHHYFKTLPHKETATLLRLTPGTIAKRLMRARARLRKELVRMRDGRRR